MKAIGGAKLSIINLIGSLINYYLLRTRITLEKMHVVPHKKRKRINEQCHNQTTDGVKDVHSIQSFHSSDYKLYKKVKFTNEK